MGLTGFNRARRESAARALAETDTAETMDGTAQAGSETMDTGEADTEVEAETAPPQAKPAARRKRKADSQ